MSEKLLTDTAVNVDETFKKIKQAALKTNAACVFLLIKILPERMSAAGMRRRTTL